MDRICKFPYVGVAIFIPIKVETTNLEHIIKSYIQRVTKASINRTFRLCKFSVIKNTIFPLLKGNTPLLSFLYLSLFLKR